MEETVANAIEYAVEQAGYESVIHEDYSGRSMYGKTTIAISVDASIAQVLSAILRASADLEDVDDFDMSSMKDDIRLDNLGMSILLY